MKPLIDWQGWARDFWKILAQHLSVAITTWLGTGGVKDGAVQWDTLWIACVIGAFFPSLAKFLGTFSNEKNTNPNPPVGP